MLLIQGWEGCFGFPCCSFAGSQVLLCFLQLVQDIARLRRRSLRHSRQLDFPKPYIAARFRSLPSHFILGDMKHYDNFENRALEPGQKYVLFILAVLQEPEAVSAPRARHRPGAAPALPPSWHLPAPFLPSSGALGCASCA